MAVNGKFEGIALDDLYAVGERNDVPGYRRVVREVRDAVAGWADFAEEAEVAGAIIKRIAADIERFARLINHVEEWTELREGLEPRPSQVGTRKRGPNCCCFE